MKKLFAFALVASVLPIASQAASIVNVSALCATGTSIELAAGTYDVSIIGESQGGQYNGWDDSTQNFGLSNAASAPGRWKDSFTISANGVTSDYVAPGDPTASSALGALANYQSSVLDANSQATDTVLLTLTSEQKVTFAVSDYLFCDNWGGESFKVTPAVSATPEPSTFGMMGLALAGTLGLVRRKFAR